MNTITNKIIEQGLSNRILKTPQLKRLVNGSDQRRYNLLNRAKKNSELIRLHRGLYVLNEKLRDFPCHPFALAQGIVPGSYISFETALSYHGWIPEKVFTTSSVAPGRKSRQFAHEQFGLFNFYPLAIQKGYFLELVNKYKVDDQTMLVANPCRALMDLVCFKKLSWQSIDWLLKGLRIDTESLATITPDDIATLKKIYKHKKVKSYISSLQKGLHLD